jgi:hypothetical protein
VYYEAQRIHELPGRSGCNSGEAALEEVPVKVPTAGAEKVQHSEVEYWEIVHQLDKVLTSRWFNTSHRCSDLLRHVVEEALQGRATQLKERLIAIEVFHRSPSYDNSIDPIVRIVASDVRKRLAQYYNDTENSGQVRIELPVGSYAPQFFLPGQQEPATPESEPDLSIPALEKHPGPFNVDLAGSSRPHSGPVIRRQRMRWWMWPTLAVILILLAAAGARLMVRPSMRPQGFDAFWAPVLSTEQPVLMSIGDGSAARTQLPPKGQYTSPSTVATMSDKGSAPNNYQTSVFDDSMAAVKIAGVLGKKNKGFEMRSDKQITFADVSSRPVIVIGAHGNDWGERETKAMRFRFEADPATNLRWIVDRSRPGGRIGALNVALPRPASFEAFSLVARCFDPLTGQPVVIVAGNTSVGTASAADFVSDPGYLNAFAQSVPRNWNSKNVEFLISTSVVEGVAGRPKLVAYQLW